MLRINDVAPDFTAETSQGTASFHEWIANVWAILFSPEFAKRRCKIMVLSVDPDSSHSNCVVDMGVLVLSSYSE